MEISPNALRKDIIQLLNRINRQLEEIDTQASNRGASPEQMVDHAGNYLLTPLLLAKSQCIHTLVLLNEQGRKK